jgi:phosphatidylglycerophosphatase A
MKADPSPASPTKSQKRTKWALAIATFCGVGYLRPGPGTWASAAAVVLWAAAAWGLRLSAHGLLLPLATGIAFTLVFGIPASTIVERESAQRDPGFVVIDEVAGQWIALLGCPVDWRHGLVALLLFRVFDITKPFPVRRFERLPGGWGIIFDDVAAGLYALLVASLVRIWF